MVDENRYCVDISNQLLATQALLKSANQEIMQAHIRSCVAEALQTDKPNPKLEEALSLLEKCLISIRLNELQEAFGLIGKFVYIMMSIFSYERKVCLGKRSSWKQNMIVKRAVYELLKRFDIGLFA